MTPLETEADPNIQVGPLRWGKPQAIRDRFSATNRIDVKHLKINRFLSCVQKWRCCQTNPKVSPIASSQGL